MNPFHLFQKIHGIIKQMKLKVIRYKNYGCTFGSVLKPYGSLFICEPKKKAEARMENLKKEIEDCGFKIIDVKPSSQFIYLNAVKL